MHLTRMALNPARRDGRRLLADPHSMHAAVLAGFPPDSHADGRVLWRIDTAPSRDFRLYVLSPTRPDLTHLVEQAGWPTRNAWETRDYAPLLSRLSLGQQWAFRLTGNPVRAVRAGEGRSRRSGHVTAAQQLDWLVARLDRCGVSAVKTVSGELDIVVSERRVQRFRRGAGTITLSTARFDGHLRVEDADRLRNALVQGVGRGKAYGCGLLTLAPAR